MNQYQKELLSLLSHSLFGRQTSVLISNEIVQEARFQSVSTLISDNDYYLLAKNIRIDFAHASLNSVLDGIPFVTIKGFSSAYYYPEPEKRPMGDVDFYVNTDDYDKAVSALLSNGFIPLNHTHERHESYSKGNVTFELHSEIKGIPNGKDGIKTSSKYAEERIRKCLSNVIDTAVRIPTQYGDIVIPDEYHHAVIMLLHVAGHMLNDGGIGLRHLCDWAVFVDKVDLERYRFSLEELGLWTFSCQLTAVCIKYLGLKSFSWVGTFEDSFLESLIEDIMLSGNFGRRDEYRTIMSCLSNNNEYKSFGELTKKVFPIVKRYPVLLPGAVVFWGIRYLIRCITGKRNLIHISDIEQGKKRNDLYKQFKLFE